MAKRFRMLLMVSLHEPFVPEIKKTKQISLLYASLAEGVGNKVLAGHFEL